MFGITLVQVLSHSGAGVGVGVTPEQVFGVTPELEKVFGVDPEQLFGVNRSWGR